MAENKIHNPIFVQKCIQKFPQSSDDDSAELSKSSGYLPKKTNDLFSIKLTLSVLQLGYNSADFMLKKWTILNYF